MLVCCIYKVTSMAFSIHLCIYFFKRTEGAKAETLFSLASWKVRKIYTFFPTSLSVSDWLKSKKLYKKREQSKKVFYDHSTSMPFKWSRLGEFKSKGINPKNGPFKVCNSYIISCCGTNNTESDLGNMRCRVTAPCVIRHNVIIYRYV